MPHISRWLICFCLLACLAYSVAGCGAANTAEGRFTMLTAEAPSVTLAEGLTLSVSPDSLTAEFGVLLNVLSAADFAAGGGGAPWDRAAALPAGLTPVGSVFAIRYTGTLPPQISISISLPAGTDAAVVDMYGWEGDKWSFIPARVREGRSAAEVAVLPEVVALFQPAPRPPLAFTNIEPGQSLTAAAAGAVNGVVLGGVVAQADGSLTGQLPGGDLDPRLAVYIAVRNYDADGIDKVILPGLLNNLTLRANHLHSLTSLAVSGDYAGLVLDYRGVDDTLRDQYTRFVDDLAAALRSQSKSLMVQVDPPALRANSYGTHLDTEGYDWTLLGASADALIVPLPENPAVYGDGSAEVVLAEAVGALERGRLHLLTSALNVESAAGKYRLLDDKMALEPLGSATAVSGTADALIPGGVVTLTLSGRVQTLEYDETAFASRYVYTAADGREHIVWLTTADTLRRRLDVAARYRLGGVVVADLLTAGVADDLAEAVTQYKVNLAAAAAAPRPAMLWTARDPSGAVAQVTAQPGQPYVYVAQAPGEYVFSAELQNGTVAELGSVAVQVITPTPTPKVYAYTGGGGSGTAAGSQPVFVPPPPVAGGPFELGGQVPGFIAHPAEMKQAGMKWVKFQATGDAAGLISAGHGAGFKVLLSAVGDRARAADPAYWPQYAGWVAGMAAQGADAIEVWNEANIDREWPNGQINGATYTQLLQQAYTAIKAANPNTMVIGGAPAPTGAAGSAGCIAALCNDDIFLAQMAQAGAANYMDCVGIHYNTGTTSPNAESGSALSGYHYSYYFWPMVNLYYKAFGSSRPLCFTEMGYLSPEGYGALSPHFSWAAGISVAQQAQWLAEAASLAANSGRVRMMIIFNVDFTLWSDDPQAGYAIIRPGGSCPACAALDAVMP